ncbi:MAG: glycosyltransferase [Acidobacteriota bacterium]
MLDRLAERRRRRSFRRIVVDTPDASPDDRRQLAQVPVLNVLPTPPRPDFGGVQIQLLQRLAAEAAERPQALLYPYAGSYRLEIEDSGQRLAVELHAAPPAFDQLEDSVFEWAVRRAVERVGAELVHFESLLGWPLASVARLQRSGLRLVLGVHDFGLFCLRPHLLERPAMQFCDYSRDAVRCARCLGYDWQVGDSFQATRRARASELLCQSEAAIFPSEFLRRTYRELMPGADEARLHVVAPALTPRETLPGSSGNRRPIRHIAAVGSVKPLKGGLLLEELLRRFPRKRHPLLRFSVYGGGDAEILQRLRRLPEVRVRGYYRAGSLPATLQADAVDLAVLPSIVPESYSLTLDECLLAGVPVLAFDHGAIGERLRRLGGGELVDPASGVEGLVSGLRRMLEQGPPEPAPIELPDATDAGHAMREIYAGILARGSAGSSD